MFHSSHCERHCDVLEHFSGLHLIQQSQIHKRPHNLILEPRKNVISVPLCYPSGPVCTWLTVELTPRGLSHTAQRFLSLSVQVVATTTTMRTTARCCCWWWWPQTLFSFLEQWAAFLPPAVWTRFFFLLVLLPSWAHTLSLSLASLLLWLWHKSARVDFSEANCVFTLFCEMESVIKVDPCHGETSKNFAFCKVTKRFRHCT